jgi:hypothetical protein
MQRQKGEIVIWHREVRWGFAATPEGKNFFVHESAFRDHRQVARVGYGTLIEFDSPVASAEQAFLDKLNAGKYRDDPTVARHHRNPRRVVISNKKLRAANVRVIGSQHPQ